MDSFQKIIDKFDDDSLWKSYSLIIAALKKRHLIRSRNIIGDRGEDIVIKYYNKTKNEPKLQLAPEGTQNVDAISRKGERYSIKTISFPNNTTSVFYGLNPPNLKKKNEQKFEYLIIVLLDSEFQPIEILETDWAKFIKYKKWHKTMQAWNITLTKVFKENCRVVFKRK